MADRRGHGRVLRLQAALSRGGVAGKWQAGTYAGPGMKTSGEARMNLLYGPDGIVIAVARPDARASMAQLHMAHARRPVVFQTMKNDAAGTSYREVVRMNLSDWIEIMAVYTQWLAQQGRLGTDE